MNNEAHQLVKRFVAPTMTRALELVQRELGPEAVILSSQRVDKGVEIVTSLEPDLPTRGIDIRRQFGQNFDADLDTAMNSDSAWRSYAGIEKAAAEYGGRAEDNSAEPHDQRTPAQLAVEIEQAREKMFAAKRQAKLEEQSVAGGTQARRPVAATSSAPRTIETASPVSEDFPEQTHLETLQNEIADMRMLLEQRLWEISEPRSQASTMYTPKQIKMPQHFALVSEHMRRLGLTENIIEELTTQLGRHQRASEAWRECMKLLARRLPINPSSLMDDAGVYAFLGQTGVGKTTTIAKLAAQSVLKHGPGKVALVTTDTYRVGAFDQLRTMGRILNVPVRVVDSENSLRTVLASLHHFPLILIDTAGFRLGDPLLKSQLEQLETSSSIKRLLVLSCNSQLATMKASVHAHKGNKGLHACVLTKLDESASMGEALSVVLQAHLPVAYTTDGQDIPKDIAAASGHGLVAKAVGILKTQGLAKQMVVH